MTKAKKVKQLTFSMPNRAGLLSEVATAVAAAKVNIYAICAYEQEENAYFILTTESIAKSKKALAKLKIKTKEDDVVVVEMPNKAGELQKVAEKIADAEININYMYGTIGTGGDSVCVFNTSDNRKVISVINR